MIKPGYFAADFALSNSGLDDQWGNARFLVDPSDFRRRSSRGYLAYGVALFTPYLLPSFALTRGLLLHLRGK